QSTDSLHRRNDARLFGHPHALIISGRRDEAIRLRDERDANMRRRRDGRASRNTMTPGQQGRTDEQDVVREDAQCSVWRHCPTLSPPRLAALNETAGAPSSTRGLKPRDKRVEIARGDSLELSARRGHNSAMSA